MRISPKIVLALYLAAMFLTLPFLPSVVAALLGSLGRGGVYGPLYGGLVLLALAPAFRLFLPPRPAGFRLHLLYLILLAGGLVVALTLASSPIGRVHLAEYAVLAILVLRCLPAGGGAGRYGVAFLVTTVIGLADETVQFFLPNRVFDWYDVALNGAAALLGVLAAAWWSLLEDARRSGAGSA